MAVITSPRRTRPRFGPQAGLVAATRGVAFAALMAAGNQGVPLYVMVLLVLGVNRFFLSALSAALPHVVAGDKLVMGNSVSPTLGGTMAAIGGLVGLVLNAATGDTERGAAITLLVAGACYLAASIVARVMGRDLLGPAREPGARQPGRVLSRIASAPPPPTVVRIRKTSWAAGSPSVPSTIRSGPAAGAPVRGSTPTTRRT